MTTRILPPEEWSKVAHTDIAAFLAHAEPRDVQIVVVEDEGCIVACWSVLRVTHLEGVWIDPAFRRHFGVARRLLEATLRTAREWGGWAFTGAQTDDVRRLITKHLHGVKVDMDTYIVPLEGR